MKALIILLLAFSVPIFTHAAEPIPVVTTTTDIAAIAKAVGGARVAVEGIAKGTQDPHYVEAKPSYMRVMNRARVLFSVGLQLEIGWLPLLVQGARNPKLVQVDLSQGIPVLERPTGPVSRAQGDIHPEGNPHYWLDPRNGVLMARRIAQELKAIAPADAALFEQNLKSFEDDLSRRRQKWEEGMARFRGAELVAYHKEWEYLAKWLGLSIIDYVEDKPGIPPAPRHLESLMQTIKQRKIQALLHASFTNPGISKAVAEKTGVKLVVLPASAGGEKGVDTYADLFETITTKLAAALKQERR